jgi:hypothetical protein
LLSLGIGISTNAKPVTNQSADKHTQEIFEHLCNDIKIGLLSLIAGYIIGLSGFDPKNLLPSRNKQKSSKTIENKGENKQ